MFACRNQMRVVRKVFIPTVHTFHVVVIMAQAINFPKIGASKHRMRPLYSADDYVGKFRGRLKGDAIQKKAVFIYSRRIDNVLRTRLGFKNYAPLEKPFRFFGVERSLKLRGVLLLHLPIGAPITATAVEELIALGVEEFLILGDAGSLSEALKPADLVVCTKALRDEGVSHHYIKNSKFVAPDKRLSALLERAMKEHNIPFKKGPTWTIDAPYMETVEELDRYANEGILTVEMEAAALFAVAKARKAKAAAVFSISDLLRPEGWTGFIYRKNLANLAYLRFADVVRLFTALDIDHD